MVVASEEVELKLNNATEYSSDINLKKIIKALKGPSKKG